MIHGPREPAAIGADVGKVLTVTGLVNDRYLDVARSARLTYPCRSGRIAAMALPSKGETE